jgi:hypothetical protein
MSSHPIGEAMGNAAAGGVVLVDGLLRIVTVLAGLCLLLAPLGVWKAVELLGALASWLGFL